MKEEKKIDIFESGKSVQEIVNENREWLLGGENFQWEYTLDWSRILILRRW